MSSSENLIIHYKLGDQESTIHLKDKMVIGRNQGCDIVLKDSSVSGRHAAVISKTGRWFLADLDSSNGILVDGEKVKQAKLVSGTRIQIGSASLIVREGSSQDKKTGGLPSVSSGQSGIKNSRSSKIEDSSELVVRRSAAIDSGGGGSVALQTLVFIGILAILFYSSFDLLRNLATDPNAMSVKGDKLSGEGAFEGGPELADLWVASTNANLTIEKGSNAIQGESWLEGSGETSEEGVFRLSRKQGLSVPAGNGLLITAAVKAAGFERFGISIQWLENDVVSEEHFSSLKNSSGWTRFALEAPYSGDSKFGSARICVVGFGETGRQGMIQVDQMVVKLQEMDQQNLVLVKNDSEKQKVTMTLDERGVGIVSRGRLEVITDLRLALGAQRVNPWGQLIPLRKEPNVVGEDGSYRVGFELSELGESSVVQQFVRPLNQAIDVSWTVQKPVPLLIAFSVPRARAGLSYQGISNGIPVVSGESLSSVFTDEQILDELSIGEGAQQVVLSMTRSLPWRATVSSDGDIEFVVNLGIATAGDAADLVVSASSAREQERLNSIILDLGRLIDDRKEGTALTLIKNVRSNLNWRDDLDDRLSLFEERIEAEVLAARNQMTSVQEDIRRYPGSPAQEFLVKICRDASVRFAGLDVETIALQILSEIEGQQNFKNEQDSRSRMTVLLQLANEAVIKKRGELARFYFQHLIDKFPGTEAASEAVQGIKIVEAKGI
ncbi:FHA domain-containing protein [Planctomycetota bacterium]|nr:FHA domain-containing protein [Planctomycetota bacterium]